MDLLQQIIIGCVGSGIIAVIALAYERRPVRRRAKSLNNSEWLAFNLGPNDQHVPMAGAGVTVIDQPRTNAWNVLRVRARDNELAGALNHDGILVLDPSSPMAAKRLVRYPNGVAVRQQLTFVDDNTIEVVALDKSQDAFRPHFLKRRYHG